MTRSRFSARATALVLAAAPLALCWPATLAAQAMVQSLVPGDADALAAQMRTLAGNPQDLTALATAGELSLKLGDLSGAAALFARADKVDPRSGRVKAGMASILVRSERPGEALRFFDQATGYGWTVDHFAADRGLAYDLIGENERAQRDYRLALQRNADDETIRRYALSLGIAGKRAEALQQLDPLVRRQDRAAWRAQAFVLAMGGDTAGAAKIATAMMPAAMNQGLGAFFQRLPTLSRTDRAFAVHFGEIYPTPERVADARLTPALTPLAPEPVVAPVQVAAVATTQQPDRRSRREQERDRRRAEQEARKAARTQVAAATSLVRMAPRREVVQALPGRTPLPSTPAPVAVAATSPVATAPVAAAAQAMRENDVRVASTTSVPTPRASTPVQVAARAPTPATTPIVTTPPAVTTAPVQVAAQPATAMAASSPLPTPTPPVQVASPAVSPVQVAAQPVPTVAASPTRTVAAATPVAVAPVASSASTGRADEVLARIVASLSIPAAELGVEPARPDPAPVSVPAAVQRAPTSTAGKRVVAEASAKEARDGAIRRVVAARVTGDAEADEPAAPRTRAGRRAAAAAQVALADTDTPPARTRTGRRAATANDAVEAGTAKTRTGRGRTAETDEPLDPRAKRAADRKAAADKKAAEEKKALAEQAAAEKKAARANPSRIWVQVAGGANEGDLGKAWNGVKAKTPALAGKSGYSTRLRATHRVLTGPFKTDAEARAFVNQLNKQGVSAFSFTSDPGQEVSRLGGK